MGCFVDMYLTNTEEQSYNTEGYKDLMEFLSEHSLNDGDKFCAELMRESSRHKSLGMSILASCINTHLKLKNL